MQNNQLNAVKIVKIVVPDIIQYGVQDTVILDCDYTYGNNTSGLVVKWFFRNKARPVYQWIVSQKPQDMGILRGRVDLAYRASSEPLKMHRALRIVKPNTDISGDYTCVVSTFMEEDSRTNQMIVFAKYAVTKEAIYYPGPMSTTPEMPTAADMQLAAVIGSEGEKYYEQVHAQLQHWFCYQL
ncbi:unnamed protein product [Parnassius apollo]|uniref:(apollo) hypothetical protein n=1 Tax=Parnassius apollo TaxID=110799 RepID=A0A8S3Y207_PARAO|nr:unnamed protein product [Parnassius apollo]